MSYFLKKFGAHGHTSRSAVVDDVGNVAIDHPFFSAYFYV
jgi:hypothetical protein